MPGGPIQRPTPRSEFELVEDLKKFGWSFSKSDKPAKDDAGAYTLTEFHMRKVERKEKL